MFCENCGRENKEGVRFCTGCGAPMKTRTQMQPPTPEYTRPQAPVPPNPAGHGKAVGSLVCGIVGVILWFFGISSIISFILGIVGMIMASSAKKEGNEEGIRTAGFVLSLISTIGGALILVACIGCMGLLGTAGLFEAIGSM